MPILLRQALAIGSLLLLSTLPPHAQAPVNSTIRPSTDSSVTTGIGTGSSFRNVAPPADQPPVDASRKFMWDTPEANEKPKQDDVKENKGTDRPAVAPPVPDVAEDPRTMITRDRIESPQH